MTIEKPNGIIAIAHCVDGFYPFQFMGGKDKFAEASDHGKLNSHIDRIECAETGTTLWTKSAH